jgi:uncharacterized membrane protein YccC
MVSPLLQLLLKDWRQSLAFSVRTWAGAMLSLYLAFELQLEAPYWAPVAALIVAQPAPGMAISKAVYRLVGSIVGSAMGVVLIALFAQLPEMFILALGLWVGACTLASNLLRNFRAYGAVLAGYTAAIVSLAAYQAPDQIFDIAMARGSCTVIGILTTLVITTLFSHHRAKQQVLQGLREVLAEAAERIAYPHDAPVPQRIILGKRAVTHLIALDPMIDFAGAEAAEFRIHENGARSLLAHLFGVISANRALDSRLVRAGRPSSPDLRASLAEIRAFFAAAPERILTRHLNELREDIDGLHHRLHQAADGLTNADEPALITDRIVADRLHDLLHHFGTAVKDMLRIEGHYAWEPSMSLNFHQDHRLAWINAARAFLAIGLAGAFWFASAWPAGSNLLIFVAVICSLFASLPNPDKLGITFFFATVAAITSAFICQFFMLPYIDGFPLLALCVGLFLIPAGLLIANPSPGVTGFGLAYGFNFLGTCRLLNPMDYDISTFLNNSLATLAGVVCGVLAYMLFIPPNPEAARRYVAHRARRGLEIIATLREIPPAWAWQTRMLDRISRLSQPANPSGTFTDEWYEAGIATLNLGNEVLRLRHLLEEGKLPAPLVDCAHNVLRGFGHIIRHPVSTGRAVEAAARRAAGVAPENDRERSLARLRLRGILEEMHAFFVEHPRFLLTG